MLLKVWYKNLLVSLAMISYL